MKPILQIAALLVCLSGLRAATDVTVFFDPAQNATLVSTDTTADTISSDGYLFTYTRDKLFTGGLTNPIGRAVRVPWPEGIEAQYVTAGPTPDKARITVRRVDGGRFDLTAFTARLLANAGAGRAIEIVPKLNGEEPLKDPLAFDVSGSYGSEFSYDTSPNYRGSTAALTNYDAYVISLTLDYALTALTLASPHVNHAPTDITLSPAAVLENEPSGVVAGVFSTVDPDAGDWFAYTLVAGAGSADNGSFSINESEVLTAESFNYEIQSNFSIRVESSDQDGLSTQKMFAITVSDVDETPVFYDPIGPTNGRLVLRWSSVTNHHYAIHCSTNLLTGFEVLESNITATPTVNIYTDAVQGSAAKFWKITTSP